MKSAPSLVSSPDTEKLVVSFEIPLRCRLCLHFDHVSENDALAFGVLARI